MGVPLRTSPGKRSVVVDGRKTSINIEQPFWDHLVRLARLRATTINALVAEIARKNFSGHLSNAVRLAVFEDVVQRGGIQHEASQQ